MKQELKRPNQTYLIHIVWIAFTFYSSMRNSSDFGQWSLRLMTIIGVISFIHILIKRNYFEVRENNLVINKELFRTKIINLDHTERIVINPRFFLSSKIIMKDKTTIKYLDSQINDIELKEFMQQFNIPVN